MDRLNEAHSWRQYNERMKLLPIATDLENYGVTLNQRRVEELIDKFQVKLVEAEENCIRLASDKYDYDLDMPKGPSNQSLNGFAFDVLQLPVVRRTDSGAPSLDSKVAVPYYLEHCHPGSDQHLFVKNVAKARKRQTSLAFLHNYLRFGIPTGKPGRWLVLHPSANPTGTDTLRWSFKNPNTANIAKQEIECMECRGEGCPECDHKGVESFNLRYCFGPAAGREWWSLDYENLELRIPAYESGEQSMIELFEQPDKEPFYGSYHLLNASIIYPDLFEPLVSQRGEFKRRYASTYYNWTKSCVPLDTEALTPSGWKSHEDIGVGDNVLGYKNGCLDWTPVLRKIYVDNALMIEMYNNHFSAISTRTHRWLGRKRVCTTGWVKEYRNGMFFTQEIGTEHEILLSAPLCGDKLLDISEDESALIGFAYGDGSVNKSERPWGPSRQSDGEKVGFVVSIYQSKPAGVEYVDCLLSRLGVNYNKAVLGNGFAWYLPAAYCRDLWRRAGIFDNLDLECMVLKMTYAQRSAYLDGVWQAEGWTDRRGTRMYAQCDYCLLYTSPSPRDLSTSRMPSSA